METSGYESQSCQSESQARLICKHDIDGPRKRINRA